MSDFVELWVYLSSTPLFGLTATLVVYVFWFSLYVSAGQNPLLNPVLWSILTIAGTLTVTSVSYQTYFSGAQFIHFLLGPAVVALAWPLWLRRHQLKSRMRRLLVAATLGGLVASLSAVGLALLLELPSGVVLSLVPKSVTAPVAMGISEAIGGIPALSAVFSVLTGLIGALTGKYIFEFFKIPKDARGWSDRGFALGTVSHGIGAARAIQVNPDAGAYAGLALGLQVVIASLLIPGLFRLLGHFF
jgi:predicted murein hydrolase (TIGR00659 family)